MPPRASNRLRIIGGLWRRRLLPFPDTKGLRPTPDRVRETLFNWLGQDLSGLACLDLFAGSGALGFEAASRGAAHVTLVDRDPGVVAALRANARELGAVALEIVQADALQFAASAGGPPDGGFDVVFLDPPYRMGWLERVAPLLSGLMRRDNAEAAVYVEAEYPLAELGEWKACRHGRAGQVHYQLLKRKDAHVEQSDGDLSRYL